MSPAARRRSRSPKLPTRVQDSHRPAISINDASMRSQSRSRSRRNASGRRELTRRPHAADDGPCLPDDLALSAGVGETMIPAT